jgi:nicotinamide mononucleotide transporter
VEHVTSYLTNNYTEVAATVLSLIYVWLSVKQKISLWLFGFLSAALFAVVFFQAKLYAVMTLQFYYLAVSVYGWIIWKKGSTDTGKKLHVKNINSREVLIFSAVTIVVFLLYYYILKFYTDSPLPFIDSLTTALSITATWMLAKKIIEHWLIWIVVDIISASLYLYKELYSTSLLFVVYTIMAVVGFLQWRKSKNS